jgi:hypothetical protein
VNLRGPKWNLSATFELHSVGRSYWGKKKEVPSECIEDLDDTRQIQLLSTLSLATLYVIVAEGRTVSYGAPALSGPSEMVDRSFATFTPEDQVRKLSEQAEAAAAKHGRFETEGWHHRKDGTWFWARALTDAVPSKGGQISSFAKVAPI